jgi:hypothetical protein
MNTAVKIQEVKIKDITVTKETITAHFMDGRTISVPLAWSWRLSEATSKQRSNWEIIGDGHGVHWPDIDEDISAEGMLYGIPPRRGHERLPYFVQNRKIRRQRPTTASTGSPILRTPDDAERKREKDVE